MKNPSSSDASWPDARRGMRNIALGTALFAVWHSFLCLQNTKNFAKARFGAKRGAQGYRAFFMLQAVATLTALVTLILRQPNRTLYRAQGAAKWLGWSAQIGALLIGAWAISDLDKAKFLGIAGVKALPDDQNLSQTGENEAQAQGPELQDDGTFRRIGAYAWSRHPLEWVPVLLLLSTPTMKTNWLVFDLLALIYTPFGALHEEKRLLAQNPEAYRNYKSKVAFFRAETAKLNKN